MVSPRVFLTGHPLLIRARHVRQSGGAYRFVITVAHRVQGQAVHVPPRSSDRCAIMQPQSSTGISTSGMPCAVRLVDPVEARAVRTPCLRAAIDQLRELIRAS